jgi:hypothetical protein
MMLSSRRQSILPENKGRHIELQQMTAPLAHQQFLGVTITVDSRNNIGGSK